MSLEARIRGANQMPITKLTYKQFISITTLLTKYHKLNFIIYLIVKLTMVVLKFGSDLLRWRLESGGWSRTIIVGCHSEHLDLDRTVHATWL